MAAGSTTNLSRCPGSVQFAPETFPLGTATVHPVNPPGTAAHRTTVFEPAKRSTQPGHRGIGDGDPGHFCSRGNCRGRRFRRRRLVGHPWRWCFDRHRPRAVNDRNRRRSRFDCRAHGRRRDHRVDRAQRIDQGRFGHDTGRTGIELDPATRPTQEFTAVARHWGERTRWCTVSSGNQDSGEELCRI